MDLGGRFEADLVEGWMSILDNLAVVDLASSVFGKADADLAERVGRGGSGL